MRENKELEMILSKWLGLNKYRLYCLSQLVLGLLFLRTSNLKRLSHYVGRESKLSSRYRRVQRFFSEVELCQSQVAKFLLTVVGVSAESKLVLILDRTNWRLGKISINILQLAVSHKGIAIPVFCKVMSKEGNSKIGTRKELLESFIKVFGKDRISCLCGDREFVGKDWFNYLRKEKIPFVSRLKKNNYVTTKGKKIKVGQLFRSLSRGEFYELKNSRSIWNTDISLTGIKRDDGEVVILASTFKARGKAISIYKKRWQIETLFGCLKSRGFNFEDTNLTKPERVENLVLVLSIAFIWAYKVGVWADSNIKKIKLKKHGRLSVSIFRYGIDIINQNLLVSKTFKATLYKLTRFLTNSKIRFKLIV